MTNDIDDKLRELYLKGQALQALELARSLGAEAQKWVDLIQAHVDQQDFPGTYYLDKVFKLRWRCGIHDSSNPFARRWELGKFVRDNPDLFSTEKVV